MKGLAFAHWLTCQELEPPCHPPPPIHGTLGDPHPLLQPHPRQSPERHPGSPGAGVYSSLPNPTRAYALPLPTLPRADSLPTWTCPSVWETRPPHHALQGLRWGSGQRSPVGSWRGGKGWAALPPLRRGRPGTLPPPPPPPPDARSPLPPPHSHRRRGGALPPSKRWGPAGRTPTPPTSPAQKSCRRRHRLPPGSLPDSPAGEGSRHSGLRPPPRTRQQRHGRAADPKRAGVGRGPGSIPLTGRPAAGPNRF